MLSSWAGTARSGAMIVEKNKVQELKEPWSEVDSMEQEVSRQECTERNEQEVSGQDSEEEGFCL